MIARLRRAVEGRTLLVVTHRMSMLKLVDRIIIIDKGTVVADGPRDEVLRSMTAAKRQQPASKELERVPAAKPPVRTLPPHQRKKRVA